MGGRKPGLNVAYVTWQFPPYVTGGSGQYAAELVPALQDAGCEITVFAPEGASLDGVRTVAVSPEPAGLVAFWRRLPAVVGRFPSKHFDVIHGNDIWDLSLRREGRPAARVMGAHHVRQRKPPAALPDRLRWLLDVRGESGPLLPILDRHAARRADRVIADSEMTRVDLIRRCGVEPDRIDVITQGMPASTPALDTEIQAFRGRFIPTATHLVASLGRLEERKGVDTLLKAFARVVQVRPNIRLVIAGDGPQEPFRRLAEHLGIASSVTFLGLLSDGERDLLLDAADLFVATPRLEGFGRTWLQAMTHGKAIVATRTGLAADGAINDEHGAVVPIDDVETTATAIARLLENDDLRRSIGSRNRHWVEQTFRWDRAAVQVIETYERALSRLRVRGALAEASG